MKYYSIIFLFVAQHAFAQAFKEQQIKSTIQDVTVFLQGAQITRIAKSEISPGRSMLIIKSLSPYIDDKSIQVKATGEFTIVSVNHKLNYLDPLQREGRIDSLKAVLKSLEKEISLSEIRIEILKAKQNVLDANKNLGGANAGASLSQLKQAIEFYDKELSSIKSEEFKTITKIKVLQEKKSQIEREISFVVGQNEPPTGQIEIRIESTNKTQADLKITYLVANVGWFPKYDVRVASIDQPLELEYKAEVYQNTGIDWEDVKLRFSNGNPNQSGVAPELQTWYLNYARNTIYNRATYGVISNSVRNVSGTIVAENGEPLPGVNVIVKGTTIGTVTDLNGNYSLTLPNGATHLVVSFIGFGSQELPITSSKISTRLNPDVMQLSEVVVSGYAIDGRTSGVRIRGASSLAKEADVITTSTIENQTTVEFEVEKPYSIKSNGEKLTIDLNSYKIKAAYEYYAVPKLDKDAFLIARIVDWDQYNLLEGEANLYFEDGYVGRSILDAKTLTDTLNISLGRDKNIVIGRTKVDEFSKRRTIGSNKIESRGFKIIVRNKKSQPIKLTLYDQIPVAAISDIIVTPTQLSKGRLDDQTGEVAWELDLNPQQNIELKLEYEVKYPKKEKLILE